MSIRGLVQGVGFRWFAKETADALEVAGWVRNRRDGSVELEAEASSAALDEYARRLKTGNSFARVDEIVETAAEPQGETRFEIRS